LLLTLASLFYAIIVNDGFFSEKENAVSEFPDISYHSMLIFVVLYIPILEEIFFRGILLYLILKKIGASLSIFLTTSIWIFLHFDFNFITIAELFIPSYILSNISIITKSIGICITLHIANNALAWLYN
jgi:membrane protease YdiL (CAAX protease family)